MQHVTFWRRFILSLVALVLLSTPLSGSASAIPDLSFVDTLPSSLNGGQSALVNSNSAPASSLIPDSEVITDTTTPAADPAQMPLTFVPNVGQSADGVEYQVHGLGADILFEEQQVVLTLPAPSEESAASEASPGTPADEGVEAEPVLVSGMVDDPTAAMPTEPAIQDEAPVAVVHLSLDGASPPAEVTPVDQLPGVINYYLGNDEEQWHEEVPTYAGLVYREVYPGIDVHYDGTQGRLKSNYLVDAGADPSVIRWRYEGSTNLWVDEVGQLHVTLPVSDSAPSESGGEPIPAPELIEETPLAWQDIGEMRLPVAIAYDIGADGSIGFTLGEYNPAYPLVLDPTLSYYSYWGSSGGDYAYDSRVDASGNLYITGTTASSTFQTSNAYDSTYGGGDYDAFVMKVNAAGSVVFSTYLGGSGWDSGEDIAVNESGYIYVTGYTNSSNYPTAYFLLPAGQTLPFGGYDVTVTNLTPTGGMYRSVYVGGTADDLGFGIAVSGSNVYVTGRTASTNFPTVSPITGHRGGNDIFVMKMNPEPGSMYWGRRYSTYLGGSGNDFAGSIEVDSSGQAYIVGSTSSTNFYPAASGFQTSNQGVSDAYVAKLNSTGTATLYSTFLGGSGQDYGNDLLLDNGTVYLTGQTFSSNFPLAAAMQPTLNGNGSTAYSDAFVTKLNSTGSQLSFSTYLGGANNEAGFNIASVGGPVYITGYTASSDFPVVNSVQSTKSLGNDIIVTGLDRATGAIIFSTWLGGSGNDIGRGIGLDGQGTVHFTGYSVSGGLNTTDNALQASSGGSYDVLIAALDNRPTVVGFYYAYYPAFITSADETQMADQSGLVILHKRSADRTFLKRLRATHGYNGLALQYVLASELQNPAEAPANSSPPWSNQWGYNGVENPTTHEWTGDWKDLYVQARANAFLWRCSVQDTDCKDPNGVDYPKVLVGPTPNAGFYLMNPGDAYWRDTFVLSRLENFINGNDGRESWATIGFNGLFLDNVHLTMNAVCDRAYKNLTTYQEQSVLANALVATNQQQGCRTNTNTPNVVTRPIFQCTGWVMQSNGKPHGTGCSFYTEAQYRTAKLAFVQAIRNRLNQVRPNTPLWGNMIGDPYSGSSWNDFMRDPATGANRMDGGMFEGWTTNFCPDPLPPIGDPTTNPEGCLTLPNGESDNDPTTVDRNYIQDALTQAQWLTDNNKSFIAVGQGPLCDNPQVLSTNPPKYGQCPNPSTPTERQTFALATYLLTVPGGNSDSRDSAANTQRAIFRYTHAYSNTRDNIDHGLDWVYYSNYDAALGEPLDGDAGRYWRRWEFGYPDEWIWRRCFTQGYVEVNPWTRTGLIVPGIVLPESDCGPQPTGP